MKKNTNKVLRLQGKTLHYPWGGKSFLPQFLHLPNPEEKPFAEYWLGAHEMAPSRLQLDSGKSANLNEYIHKFPTETLGIQVAEKFGRLPYLLKILDVRDMLSIQVHPSKKNAEHEYAEENRRGVAMHAADRNYRDDNHKPELMLALSEFWLLHGFKSSGPLARILKETKELNFLTSVFERGAYAEVYKTVMEMQQADVNTKLQPLLDRIVPAYQEGVLRKADENFWAARAAITFNSAGHIDRGIFSIYFFNLLMLDPGQAVFQDAGIPHAYLEGQNVEIMANSDNVLRGGLTSKRVDIKELLKHVNFEATVPRIIQGMKKTKFLQVFGTPAPDFELGKLELPKGDRVEYTSVSAEIFLLWSGDLTIHENQQNEFSLKPGEAFISFDAAEFQLNALNDSVLFKGSVPVAFS
jgi:mannose-6-phosphate isomerase